MVEFLAAKRGKHDPQLSYFPDLIPVDFVLFLRVKSELAGVMLSQDTFKNSWEGVVGTITKDELPLPSKGGFSTVIQKKCIQVEANNLEK